MAGRYARSGWAAGVAVRIRSAVVPSWVRWDRVRRAGLVAGAAALVLLYAVPLAVGGLGYSGKLVLATFAPLPVQPSSLMASGIGAGALTAGEAATLGGSSAVVASGFSAPVVGQVALAGVGAFAVTAGVVGVVMRATGQSTSGMCSVGAWLGALYGDSCANASIIRSPQAPPMVGLQSYDFTLCTDAGECYRVQGPVTIYRWGDRAQGATTADTPEYGSAVTGLGNATVPTSGLFMSYTQAGSNSGYSFSPYSREQWSAIYDQNPSRYIVEYQSPAGMYAPPLPAEAVCVGLADYGAGACTSTGPAPDAGQRAVSPTRTGDSDPLVYLEAVTTFTDGTTSAPKRTATYRQSSGKMPTFPENVVPQGKVVASYVVREWLADGTASRLVLEQNTSPEYQELVQAYPECADGACRLQVYYKGKPCVVGVSACADWFVESPNNPDYACKYGPAPAPAKYDLALDECAVLQPYYRADRQKDGTPYADPRTGADVDTTTGPKGGTEPGTGTVPGQTPVEAGTGDVGDPQDVPGCMAELWSAGFNPVAWVVTPAKCVLQWAFKPSDAAIESTSEGNDAAWKASPLGAVVAAAGGALVLSDFGTAGCKGPPFTIHLPHIGGEVSSSSIDDTWYPMDACTDPMAGVAGTVKALLTAIIWLVAVMGALRYVAAIVGFVGFGSQTPGGEDHQSSVPLLDAKLDRGMMK